MDARTSPGGEVIQGMHCVASRAPGLTQDDADALEAFYWWPYWSGEEDFVPDYSDVQD